MKKNREVAGAEGLFDIALNNGLAAIVASAWPGDELERNGKVKSAKFLLDALSERAAQRATTNPTGNLAGTYLVRVVDIVEDPETHVITLTVSRWSEADEPTPSGIPFVGIESPHDVVVIDTVALRQAIEVVYPVRHGRQANGSLDDVHVAALVALGEHPVIGDLYAEEADDQWMRDQARDAWLQGNAAEYLELLGEEEIARRVEIAEDYLPFDPKDRSIAEPLHECPVCWNETMVCSHTDMFGLGFGIGTCIVCGYTRTDAIADDEAMTWKLQNLPDD